MSLQPEKENKFEGTFKKSIGKRLTIYMKNGKAMPGVLRSYNSRTACIDTPDGVKGGTEIDCEDISTVSQK